MMAFALVGAEALVWLFALLSIVVDTVCAEIFGVSACFSMSDATDGNSGAAKAALAFGIMALLFGVVLIGMDVMRAIGRGIPQYIQMSWIAHAIQAFMLLILTICIAVVPSDAGDGFSLGGGFTCPVLGLLLQIGITVWVKIAPPGGASGGFAGGHNEKMEGGTTAFQPMQG